MSGNSNPRIDAMILLVAPAVLLAGILYHPHIANLTDNAAVAAAVSAGPTRWAISHLVIGVGSGLLALAFIVLQRHLQEAGEARWSAFGLPFVVLGSTLFAMLPAMEMAPWAAVETGADPYAVQVALDRWFVPFLMGGAAIFLIGAVAFAVAIPRSRILGPGASRLVATALVLMALVRFVPMVTALTVGGIAGIAALWPVAIRMWRAVPARRHETAAAYGG